MSRAVLWLIMILVVGLALRLFGLGTESLWADEGITVSTVALPLLEMLTGFDRSVHPPFYYVLLHSWTRIFGDSEVAVRLPSVVFGVVTIYLTYRMGRTLFTPQVGLIAATIVALSLFQIRYSQEARNYMLMCMLALTSYLFVISLDKGPTRSNTLGYALSSVLLTYTHVFGMFVIISQNLYFLLRKAMLGRDCQPSWRPWLGLQALLGILYIPWGTVVWSHVVERQTVAEAAWQPTPSLRTLVGVFASYVGSAAILLGFAALTVILAAVVLRSIPKHQQDLRATLGQWFRRATTSSSMSVYLLVVWIFGVAILPFILSQILSSFYRPRYTIAASIPFYLLLSLVIFKLLKIRAVMAVVALLLVFYVVDAYNYYSIPNKERWREATHDIEALARSDDLVIVNAGQWLHTNFSYYATRRDLVLVPFFDKRTYCDGDPVRFEEDLDGMIAARDRVWILLSHRDRFTERLLGKFEAPWQVVERKEYFSTSHVRQRPYLGIEVLLFAR